MEGGLKGKEERPKGERPREGSDRRRKRPDRIDRLCQERPGQRTQAGKEPPGLHSRPRRLPERTPRSPKHAGAEETMPPKVSSVLNRDVKQYGKKYMFDSNEETCWNSDQGERQWLVLDFPQPIMVSELKVQFQGGFSAKTCRLEGGPRCGQSKNTV
ncbi:nuclear receptor 2C2-associated protein isoform X2 [Nerophis lumbriciformis]|uniref:nuclear receptor 2C2-associated protein isoform X2 n=1 Tax=Nerophis lumbriciformis TaxID=546530 RepID=UPI003BA93852